MENNDIRVDDDTAVDLDLNQEPSSDPPVDPVVQLGSLLSELETAHGQIEHRIRQLEAVTTRASERQRWRRQAANPLPETSNIVMDQLVIGGAIDGEELLHNRQVEGELHHGNVNVNASQEMVIENGKRFTNGYQLVAKALAMDAEVNKVSDKGGSFFDCHFCLRMAREPILTCCGHLFCWKCFFKLPYAYGQSRECPECNGEVAETSITPIYGNGNKTHTVQPDSGIKIPPRPQAQRIESVRQRRVSRRANRGGGSHIPVAEALRRIRSGVGTIGQRQDLDVIGESSDNNNNNVAAANQVPASEVRSNLRFGSHQFSRVLSESAASLSSISSALNDAERLVDDLESYIQDRLLARSNTPFPPLSSVLNPLFANDPLLQPEQIGNTSTAVPIASSSTTDVSAAAAAVVPMEYISADTATENNLDVSQPSSSRRRSGGGSRVSDVENGVSREPRRRRLR